MHQEITTIRFVVIDDAGVLTEPSDTRIFGEDAFNKRPGIDIGASVAAPVRLDPY